MKEIDTQGISYLTRVDGNTEWYWGTDCSCGDLYEAEEAFKEGRAFTPNRLLFVHYPDGRTVCPVTAREGQYLGRPVFCDGRLIILLVDFPAGAAQLLGYDDACEQTETIAEIPMSDIESCYNLFPHASPLMLARQANDGVFRIIWPFRAEFAISHRESFDFRDGDRLYFAEWHEDADGSNYGDDVVVRSLSGELLERIPNASIQEMPDGQKWLLR